MLGNRDRAEISKEPQQKIYESRIDKVAPVRHVLKLAADQFPQRRREIRPCVPVSKRIKGKPESQPGRPSKDKCDPAEEAQSPSQASGYARGGCIQHLAMPAPSAN